jgi:hypothetical protein
MRSDGTDDRLLGEVNERHGTDFHLDASSRPRSIPERFEHVEPYGDGGYALMALAPSTWPAQIVRGIREGGVGYC